METITRAKNRWEGSKADSEVFAVKSTPESQILPETFPVVDSRDFEQWRAPRRVFLPPWFSFFLLPFSPSVPYVLFTPIHISSSLCLIPIYLFLSILSSLSLSFFSLSLFLSFRQAPSIYSLAFPPFISLSLVSFGIITSTTATLERLLNKMPPYVSLVRLCTFLFSLCTREIYICENGDWSSCDFLSLFLSNLFDRVLCLYACIRVCMRVPCAHGRKNGCLFVRVSLVAVLFPI